MPRGRQSTTRAPTRLRPPRPKRLPPPPHYEGTAEVSFVGADEKSLFGGFRLSHRVGEHQWIMFTRFWQLVTKYMSLDVVARWLSDVEVGWNSFRAPFLTSGGFAGGSLAGFEGELLLCGWRGLSPARKFSGA